MAQHFRRHGPTSFKHITDVCNILADVELVMNGARHSERMQVHMHGSESSSMRPCNDSSQRYRLSSRLSQFLRITLLPYSSRLSSWLGDHPHCQPQAVKPYAAIPFHAWSFDDTFNISLRYNLVNSYFDRCNLMIPFSELKRSAKGPYLPHPFQRPQGVRPSHDRSFHIR